MIIRGGQPQIIDTLESKISELQEEINQTELNFETEILVIKMKFC
jgi:hypothetical protein